MKLALAMLICAGSLHASDCWTALAQVESGACDTKLGACGEVGRYQQKPRFWKLYTSLPLSSATNPFTALAVAKLDMADRVKNFEAHNGRQPTPGEWPLIWHSKTSAVLHPNREQRDFQRRFLNLLNAK